jgi:hypothetical protein
MDVRKLAFGDQTFDIAIDKGTSRLVAFEFTLIICFFRYHGRDVGC